MYRAWAAFFFAAISSRLFASFSSCLWASSVKASAGMPSWVGAWIGRSWVLVSIARSSFSSRLGLVWLLDGGTLVGVGEAEAAFVCAGEAEAAVVELVGLACFFGVSQAVSSSAVASKCKSLLSLLSTV